MQLRLLDFLCCPDCKKKLQLLGFTAAGDEVTDGVLHCEEGHFYPIAGGIPRMLPGSFREFWPELETRSPKPLPQPLDEFLKLSDFGRDTRAYDRRTKANFSNEWDNHDIGGKTWTMDLSDRIQWFFLDPIRIPKDELKGKLMLDAGCGNGSQSVAYTELGLEVVAVDLSSGLEKGYAFRSVRQGAKPDKVHFVQADLQNPPISPDTFDIIHSAGVLHHTPDTLWTFKALRPLLKSGGTFYVWLYKYEKFVTPIVNTMRAVTTRIPAPIFEKIADVSSVPFIGFCWAVNKLGIRRYETPNRREAAIAVHDIFGAPYAHYHNFEEVSDWYKAAGFKKIWPCNDDRRGFGVCGTLPRNGGQPSQVGQAVID